MSGRLCFSLQYPRTVTHSKPLETPGNFPGVFIDSDILDLPKPRGNPGNNSGRHFLQELEHPLTCENIPFLETPGTPGRVFAYTHTYLKVLVHQSNPHPTHISTLSVHGE